MSSLQDKLSKLQGDTPSQWKAAAKYRRDNREWLKKSAAIAVKVLDALKAQELTQKDLAERMQVSPQHINKIVKGRENLTLETITNLEMALGIKIIEETAQQKKSAA